MTKLNVKKQHSFEGAKWEENISTIENSLSRVERKTKKRMNEQKKEEKCAVCTMYIKKAPNEFVRERRNICI